MQVCRVSRLTKTARVICTTKLKQHANPISFDRRIETRDNRVADMDVFRQTSRHLQTPGVIQTIKLLIKRSWTSIDRNCFNLLVKLRKCFSESLTKPVFIISSSKALDRVLLLERKWVYNFSGKLMKMRNFAEYDVFLV